MSRFRPGRRMREKCSAEWPLRWRSVSSRNVTSSDPCRLVSIPPVPANRAPHARRVVPVETADVVVPCSRRLAVHLTNAFHAHEALQAHPLGSLWIPLRPIRRPEPSRFDPPVAGVDGFRDTFRGWIRGWHGQASRASTRRRQNGGRDACPCEREFDAHTGKRREGAGAAFAGAIPRRLPMKL